MSATKWKPKSTTLRIVAAAVKHHGVIHTAPHHHLAMWQISCCWGEKAFGELGFVANDGKFYGRAESKLIAHEAGQIKFPLSHAPAELYSEELWSYADWLKERKMGDSPDAASSSTSDAVRKAAEEVRAMLPPGYYGTRSSCDEIAAIITRHCGGGGEDGADLDWLLTPAGRNWLYDQEFKQTHWQLRPAIRAARQPEGRK